MKQQHRTLLLTTLTTILLGIAPAAAKAKVKHYFGIKGGVVASIPYDIIIQSDEFQTSAIENVGRVGSTSSVAWMIEINRFFIQPELTYAYSQGGARFFIESNVEIPSLIDEQEINYKYHLIALPIQLGYNFVKKDKYSFGAYVAPQVNYLIKASYTYNGDNTMPNINPWGLHVGLGINIIIDRIAMDLRYAYAPISNKVEINPQLIGSDIPSCTIKQRNNLLSINVGYYF